MDDMQAIEQRISRELLRRAGPSEPVDDAAIFTVVSATRSPRWRFQSVFGAFRFVVAAVVVTLFGGLLLAGLVAGPTDEPALVVGATASVRAGPSDAPSPTSELLPGVGLITEEVEPGVYRVINDGVRDLARPLADYDYSFYSVEISAGRDGSVWLHPSASTWHGRPVDNPPDHAVPFRLGAPVDPRIDDETNDPDGVEHDAPLAYRDPIVREDGTLFVAADGIWSFADRPDEDAWQQQLGGAGWDYAIADDGSVWSIAGVFDMTVLGRKSDGSPWDAVEVPWRFENEPSLLSVSRSGDVWLRSEAWFARYDGADWQRWRSPIGDQGPAVLGLDGTLWTVAAECYECRSLARFDGVEWTVYEAADGVPPLGGYELPIVLEAAPDGSVWLNSVPKDPRQADDEASSSDAATEPLACGGVHHFDGRTWARYLDGICVYDLDIAPDGKAWLRGGTFDLAAEEFGSVTGPVEVYVISPDAAAAAG